MLLRTVIHEIVNHDDVTIGVLNLQELVVGILFPFKIYGLLGFYLTPAAVFVLSCSIKMGFCHLHQEIPL